MKRATRVVALSAALMLVLAACGDDNGDGGGTGGGGKLGFNQIKVGVVFPLTGALSDFGPAGVRALRLAEEVFEEAARKAGENIDVTVQVEDSGTDPGTGTEAAQKLVADGVNFIVGAYASGVTIPVAQSVTIPNNIVQISPASTSGDITKLEDNNLVWRTPPSDEFQAPILAQFVVDELGKDGEIALGARNDAYGAFIINGVQSELQRLGAQTRKPVLWDPNATSFESEARRLTRGNPAGWVLVDFPGTWQAMSSALVRTGNWDAARTFTADGLKVSTLAQSAGAQAANGLRGTAPGGTGAFNELWDQRVQDVRRETFDAHAFDAMIVGLLAAVAADSNNSEQIKAEMRNVSGPGGTAYTFENLSDAIRALVEGNDIDYEGASGPLNFDENGDPQSEGALYDVWQIRDGDLTVVRAEEAERAAAG